MGNKSASNRPNDQLFVEFNRRFDIMLNEPPGVFLEYNNFITSSTEILATNPSFHELVVQRVKASLKDKLMVPTMKFKAMLALKDLMETHDPKLVVLNGRKMLNTYERILLNPQREAQFLNVAQSEQEQQYATALYRLILECSARWGDLAGSPDVPYRESAERVRTSLGMAPLRPEDYQFFQLAPPQVITTVSAVPSYVPITTTTIIREQIITPPIEMRRRMIELLLVENLNIVDIKRLITEFESLPPEVRAQSPDDINFFVNLKDLFGDRVPNKIVLYNFLQESL